MPVDDWFWMWAVDGQGCRLGSHSANTGPCVRMSPHILQHLSCIRSNIADEISDSDRRDEFVTTLWIAVTDYNNWFCVRFTFDRIREGIAGVELKD